MNYQYDLFEHDNGAKARRALGYRTFLGSPCKACGSRERFVCNKKCVHCGETNKTYAHRELDLAIVKSLGTRLSGPVKINTGNFREARQWVEKNIDYGVTPLSLIKMFNLTRFNAGQLLREYGISV